MSEDEGFSLGSHDTGDDSKRHYDGTHSSDDESSLELPNFPLEAAKAKKRARYKLVYTGSEAIIKVAKAVNESRRTGAPLNTDIFVPPTSPDLLHELSLRPLSLEKLEMTMTLNAVVRECELLAEDGVPKRDSNVNDLRRLLRVYDDFALANVNKGAKIDTRHRLALFLARMKVLNALTILLPRVDVAHDDAYVRDDYWVDAQTISNMQLARWLYANRACHALLLVVDDQLPRTHPNYVAGHLIEHCTLECFWQSLLALTAAWPYLAMSAYVVRAFDAFRARAAFFLSYRELATPDTTIVEEETFSLKKQIDMSRTKVLGLNLNLFGLMDLNEPEREPLKPTVHQQSTLLDNVDLVKISENYIHVNLDFAEECDKLFQSMQLDLRRCAGFTLDKNVHFTDVITCVGCERKAIAASANVTLFEALIDEQTKGTFRTQISEEFREMLFQFYEQPHEVQSFREYHGYEVITAQNCISQQRPRDYKLLCERFTGAQCDVVWQNLRGHFDEPAHGILCIIALNYYMQQSLKGARVTTYLVDLCKSGAGVGVKPHEHLDERAGLHRNAAEDFHVQMTTTGTFLFRNKLVHQDGFEVDADEINYQHPLIIRSLNSFGVHYSEHLHQCRSFAHAFLTWLVIMCEDRCIDAQLTTGAFLHELYARLFPERFERVKQLAEEVDRRLRKYNPLAKFVDPHVTEAEQRLQSRNMTQF
jgi:hypothetical protein